MAILDIRLAKQEIIDSIKFDDSNDVLCIHSGGLYMYNGVIDTSKTLCKWNDFDNFIAACHKARELWGPK